MKASGAKIATYALEQLGVQFVMGIPGVHNTELYDELNKSKKITPILVTHEVGASFIADGISRTSVSIGVILIVPAAGVTHAASGIAEAYLDGIPMLIISGGIRRDTGKSYQLHDIDQERLTAGFVKKYFKIISHDDIIETFFTAHEIATSGEPGPVFIELPADIQLFEKEVSPFKTHVDYTRKINQINPSKNEINRAVDALLSCKKPGIYIGWGARDATDSIASIAESIGAPVSTTLQGISSFPYSHPHHTGMGFGVASVPAAYNAFKDCDCLLAVGVRFSELGTGSYSINPPPNLIHVDINPDVFNKNYPASQTLCGDAKKIMDDIAKEIKNRCFFKKDPSLLDQIKHDKHAYRDSWGSTFSCERVSPYYFFKALATMSDKDAYIITDDGNHTFLTAELFPINMSKHFICPTDFNAMGYAVPSSIGVKLGNPTSQVICIVGDGGILMTGLEILTARNNNLGILYLVFNDGELGMISSFQKTALNRKTCSTINNLAIDGIALATGAKYFNIKKNSEIEDVLAVALHSLKENVPVLVDVYVNYDHKTQFSKGVVKTNFSRFTIAEKMRFLSRAIKRHMLG